MAHTPDQRHNIIEKSVAAYRAAGGTDDAAARETIRQVLDHGGFAVGDEVACSCGNIVGVIISFDHDDALISWACRGKSLEPVTNLVHVPHGTGV